MIETDLTESNLTDADLTEADLSGALLSGANVDQANFQGANVDDTVETKETSDLSEEIRALLKEYELWIETNGQRGQRGDFRARSQ